MPDKYYVALGVLSERIILAKQLLSELQSMPFLEGQDRTKNELILSHETKRMIGNLKLNIVNYENGNFPESDTSKRVSLNRRISEVVLWLRALEFHN